MPVRLVQDMDEEQQFKLKNDLILVITTSFDRAAIKKFKELNFVFPSSEYDNKSKRKFLDNKLTILKELDVYSKTFLSIHTRAKIALREIQSQKFNGAYLELLKMILTLHESIAKKKSQGIREKEKHEWELMEVGEDITPRNDELIHVVIGTKGVGRTKETEERKIKYLKENITGHDISKVRNKTKEMINKCADIEL